MTSSHHNQVEIQANSIQTIEYIPDSLVITEEQPFSPPPSISKSGNTWTIDMECGRKGSSSVAGQFTNISGGIGHVYSPTTMSDPSPDDLNFYFGVRVSFKVGNQTFSAQLYLGQGSRASRNNWWIGGQRIAHNSHAILVIGDTQQVFTISGDISNFVLSPWFT